MHIGRAGNVKFGPQKTLPCYFFLFDHCTLLNNNGNFPLKSMLSSKYSVTFQTITVK